MDRSQTGQLSSTSAPAPVSRSLGEAGWTGWDVGLGYLWISISLAPCDSQEHPREAAKKYLSGPRRKIQLSNESTSPEGPMVISVSEGPRETVQMALAGSQKTWVLALALPQF